MWTEADEDEVLRIICGIVNRTWKDAWLRWGTRARRSALPRRRKRAPPLSEPRKPCLKRKLPSSDEIKVGNSKKVKFTDEKYNLPAAAAAAATAEGFANLAGKKSSLRWGSKARRSALPRRRKWTLLWSNPSSEGTTSGEAQVPALRVLEPGRHLLSGRRWISSMDLHKQLNDWNLHQPMRQIYMF